MKFNTPTPFCVVYHSQQANGTSGAQTPMHGGRSSLPQDHIIPSPAEYMINDIWEELDDDAGMWHRNPQCFTTARTGFEIFEWKLQIGIIREQ